MTTDRHSSRLWFRRIPERHDSIRREQVKHRKSSIAVLLEHLLDVPPGPASPLFVDIVVEAAATAGAVVVKPAVLNGIEAGEVENAVVLI